LVVLCLFKFYSFSLVYDLRIWQLFFFLGLNTAMCVTYWSAAYSARNKGLHKILETLIDRFWIVMIPLYQKLFPKTWKFSNRSLLTVCRWSFQSKRLAVIWVIWKRLIDFEVLHNDIWTRAIYLVHTKKFDTSCSPSPICTFLADPVYERVRILDSLSVSVRTY